MNRISHLMGRECPEPVGPFSEPEALDLLWAYRRDPSSVPCPTCGPNAMEVLAFIEPEIDMDGVATVTEPEGEYAAALYCRLCRRAVGILVGVK